MFRHTRWALASRRAQLAAGFTLVELAIVMLVIGILIAGTLQAQTMMRNSRLKATIAQVQAYDSAITTFFNTYQFLPGDSPAATSILPNCNTANSCTNGDGDKYIGPQPTSAANCIGGNGFGEPAQAWKHMALAGFIGGIDITADPVFVMNTTATHPPAPINGAFEVLRCAFMGSTTSNHVLRIVPTLRYTNSAIYDNPTAGSGAWSLYDIYALKTMLGEPEGPSGARTGRVRHWGNGCRADGVGGDLDLTRRNRDCVVYFMINPTNP